jgi:hypothetical protein
MAVKIDKIIDDSDKEEYVDDLTHALIKDILEFSKDKSLSIMETSLILNNTNKDYGNEEAIDIKVVFRVNSSYLQNKLENKFGFYTTRNSK